MPPQEKRELKCLHFKDTVLFIRLIQFKDSFFFYWRNSHQETLGIDLLYREQLDPELGKGVSERTAELALGFSVCTQASRGSWARPLSPGQKVLESFSFRSVFRTGRSVGLWQKLQRRANVMGSLWANLCGRSLSGGRVMVVTDLAA